MPQIQPGNFVNFVHNMSLKLLIKITEVKELFTSKHWLSGYA